MATTALATMRFGALRPADAQAEEAFRSIPNGETVRIEVTRPSRRSLQHHRLFFALLNIVAEQLDWTADQCLTWTKLAVGHFDSVLDRAGNAYYIPKSISFGRMTQDEFRVFFDRAVTAILDRLLPPGTPRADLVAEIEERAALMSRRAA